MQELSDKITGNTLTAVEWNEVPKEIENIIEKVGIALSSGDLNQLGKAISDYVAAADFYISTGGPAAYILTNTSYQNPASLSTGMVARFRPNINNTGAVTINVATLGVKAVLTEIGAALVGGELSVNRDSWIRYDGTQWLLSNSTASSELQSERGAISGLQMSNDVSDTAHDIQITLGNCRDDLDSETINLAAIITKQIDVDWVAGDNVGGIAAAISPVVLDTWYHVFVIRKNNGLVDAGFDTNINASNLLADSGYDQFRRIGSVLTDASANIIQFIQLGDDFQWFTLVNDYNVVNPGAASVLVTLSTPLDVSVLANIAAELNDDASSGTDHFLVFSAGNGSTTIVPSLILHDLRTAVLGDNAINANILTDTSKRIRFKLDSSDANLTVTISTRGWKDDRGKSA